MRVKILVEGREENFEGVLERAQAVGFEVEEQSPKIGALVGSIDQARLDKLRDIEGVKDIETEITAREL